MTKINNTPDNIKIIDTRDDSITVPHVIIETVGGIRICLPYTYEDLDRMDDNINQKKEVYDHGNK